MREEVLKICLTFPLNEIKKMFGVGGISTAQAPAW